MNYTGFNKCDEVIVFANITIISSFNFIKFKYTFSYYLIILQMVSSILHVINLNNLRQIYHSPQIFGVFTIIFYEFQ